MTNELDELLEYLDVNCPDAAAAIRQLRADNEALRLAALAVREAPSEGFTPVDMTILHDPENGKIGDCFRACIASLLGITIELVPHFCDYPWSDPDGGRWYRHLNKWLEQFDLAYIEIPVSPDALWNWNEFTVANFHVYHTLSGHSARARHTVVALNGQMVHDPHPSREGLIGPYKDGDQSGMYEYGFLVRRCFIPLTEGRKYRERVRREERERCAKTCEAVYGGKAHAYASENADTYRIQDQTIASCAKAIRALADKPEEPTR